MQRWMLLISSPVQMIEDSKLFAFVSVALAWHVYLHTLSLHLHCENSPQFPHQEGNRQPHVFCSRCIAHHRQLLQVPRWIHCNQAADTPQLHHHCPTQARLHKQVPSFRHGTPLDNLRLTSRQQLLLDTVEMSFHPGVLYTKKKKVRNSPQHRL